MRALKMNGTGNAFLLIDARSTDIGITPERLSAWAKKHEFDQVLKLEPSEHGDARYRIWNRDSGEVGACGNGARCAGWYLCETSNAASARLDTAYGLTDAIRTGDFRMSVDLGEAHTDWRDIPLAREMDTRALDYEIEMDGHRLRRPGAVSMGNPHAVFFIDPLDGLPVETLGPRIEHDPLFPERVNAGFVQVLARDHIRLRVWERGAGLTKACGTGAAAAVVAGVRRDLLERECRVDVDGGRLQIDWKQDNHVWLDGPVELDGEVEL
ncbi:diaminopimelate epimerase [Hyphobacterium sp. HN65]|uniref:Diaminopimelate epimerase n=1 Tax=Hyphobacterium lacteum TaxID=3116575 RepID=A0ABU7LS60_9PROT|nr:diaminopimelate epimerase [Hyphobacterium sp. HN65]MEE2526758.1 diaminopimelate epimerase [Hyphobacterium sp. HN65]